MSDFSNQEIEILKQMRNEGYGYTKIAEKLDKTFAEVKNECLKRECPPTDGDKISEKLTGQYKFSDAYKHRAKNKVLLGVLWVRDMPISELADRLDMSSRSVQRYIYEGEVPPRHVQREISSILGIPPGILFWADN